MIHILKEIQNIFFGWSGFLSLIFFFFAYGWTNKVNGTDYPDASHINDLQNEKMDRDGEIPATGTIQWDKGEDVASASTLQPGSDGNYFDVTGTTNIDKITPAQSQPGTWICLHFDSALTVNHDGDFIVIPGGNNLSVQAGAELIFIEYTAGKFRLVGYFVNPMGVGVVYNEPGLGNRITFGLDETARTMVICDSGDVKSDLGLSASSYPKFYLFDADADSYLYFGWSDDDDPQIGVGGAAADFKIASQRKLQIYSNVGGGGHNLELNGGPGRWFSNNNIRLVPTADISSGHFFYIDYTESGHNKQLTDDNGEQAWVYLKPGINQSATAGYIGFLMDVIENGTGDGSAGAGYNALAEWRVGGTAKFTVKNDGSVVITGSVDIQGDLDMNEKDIQNIETAWFKEEHDNGNSGAAKTIDWNNGQKQKVTLTDDATLTLTDPGGPCNLILKLVQDGTGSRSPSWSVSGSIYWPDGTEPTWSTGAGEVDIISFYFDGTDYYGQAGLNFS